MFEPSPAYRPRTTPMRSSQLAKTSRRRWNAVCASRCKNAAIGTSLTAEWVLQGAEHHAVQLLRPIGVQDAHGRVLARFECCELHLEIADCRRPRAVDTDDDVTDVDARTASRFARATNEYTRG